MTHRSVSNTLSRWHKVVDRVKTAVNDLAADIHEGVLPVRYNNYEVFRAEQPIVTQATTQALDNVELLFKLNAALGTIREALARANVDLGVSNLLATQVCKQNERTLLQNLIHAAAGARLPLSAATQVLRAKGDGQCLELHQFMRVEPSQVEQWTAQSVQLGRELSALADKLSDVNAQRLSIALDEAVLAHLGM